MFYEKCLKQNKVKTWYLETSGWHRRDQYWICQCCLQPLTQSWKVMIRTEKRRLKFKCMLIKGWGSNTTGVPLCYEDPQKHTEVFDIQN